MNCLIFSKFVGFLSKKCETVKRLIDLYDVAPRYSVSSVEQRLTGIQAVAPPPWHEGEHARPLWEMAGHERAQKGP